MRTKQAANATEFHASSVSNSEGIAEEHQMKAALALLALATVTVAIPTADARNWDRVENRWDRRENVLDRREDRRDRREDRRDLREDYRDAQHQGGWRDQREDV